MSRDMDEENLLSGIWPEWKIIEFIGSGSYGSVYKAVRDEFSIKSFSAIKIISVPQNESEIIELRVEGYDDATIRKYYQKIASRLANEIECLVSLKSASNIVRISDFKVMDKEDIGCNIYLRMELLTPLNQYILDKKMSQAEIVRLGMDICKALECCSEQNIVHRDIKPDNIFISEYGEFKLGDFGIAKRLDNETLTISHQGVSGYIAPEVIKGENYNTRADIYSLGIVLYKLLNNNRFPFVGQIGDWYESMLEANIRRLEGENLPAPVNADKELSAVILRACEYEPEKRFQSPAEFGNALAALQSREKNVSPIVLDRDGDIKNAKGNEDTENTLKADLMMFEPEQSDNRKKLLIIGIVILVIMFAGGVFLAISVNKIFTKSEESESVATTSMSESVLITQESLNNSTTEYIEEENAESDVEITDAEKDEITELESEAATENNTTEEATTEEPTTEEPTTEELTTEEVTTEEATTEEATTEEATTEEPTTAPVIEEKDLYIVPKGCSYYDASSGEVYPAGRGIDVIPQDGDEFRTADYIYIYDNLCTKYTWRVTVKDKTKTEYETIMDTIAGKKVESMHATFDRCINLKTSPDIPDSVNDLCYTFRRCESLEVAPELPANIEGLEQTFYYCIRLKEIPEIPDGVKTLLMTFGECYSLKNIPAIPNSVINLGCTFQGCYSIETVESLPCQLRFLNGTFCGCKKLIKAPEIPNGVESMHSAFEECDSLIETPVIPDTVKSIGSAFFRCDSLEKVLTIPNGVEDMEYAFTDCCNLREIPPIPESVKNMTNAFSYNTLLTGEIVVNANPEKYSGCFFEIYGITLKGTSNMLEELNATKWEY